MGVIKRHFMNIEVEKLVWHDVEKELPENPDDIEDVINLMVFVKHTSKKKKKEVYQYHRGSYCLSRELKPEWHYQRGFGNIAKTGGKIIAWAYENPACNRVKKVEKGKKYERS